MSLATVFRTMLIPLLLGIQSVTLAAEQGLTFSLEFQRSASRLVKVGVSSDEKGSSIRTLVLELKGGSIPSERVRDRQRRLSEEEARTLATLVAVVRPPMPRKEVINEGSLWIFRKGDEDPVIFRSPTLRPRERQLEEIRAVGEYLWKIEGLRQDAGLLF